MDYARVDRFRMLGFCVATNDPGRRHGGLLQPELAGRVSSQGLQFDRRCCVRSMMHANPFRSLKS